MANDNLLADFTDYIENLCAKHVEIQHTQFEKHFFQLNDEEQLNHSKNLNYPVVTLDKLEISYTGMEDALSKNRMAEMLFLDTVADNGDFDQIQLVKNRMEAVAEDFLKKMKLDRKDKTLYPFLKCLRVSNITMHFVEHKGNCQYGVLLLFNFELPFVETLAEGRFI